MTGSNFTLSELNREIKSCIESRFTSPVWVIAEINSMNIHRSGHCYLELVQKSDLNDSVIASARGVIWSSIFNRLKAYFETTSGTDFEKGLKVLVKVSVDYHAQFGLSLNIRDIDPAYTLGDIARRRKEIIDKLEKENVIDINKTIEIPLIIKNIAVISSASAAGYEDFMNQLNKNSFNYKFNLELFEANMQGQQTEKSVISAFDSIFQTIEKFDIVCILRGGGSKTDLAAFDNYNIAFYVTQFPIPVITGIGHERDETVTDIVANTRLKTPTAAAEFIINNNAAFEAEINGLANSISEKVRDYLYINNLIITNVSVKISKLRKHISDKTENCNDYFYRLRNALNRNMRERHSHLELLENRKRIYSKEIIKNSDRNLDNYILRLRTSVKQELISKQRKLDNIENNVRLTDPANILKRGFSITKLNGKIVSDASKLQQNDEIETVFAKSSVKSKVVNNKRN
jgi:exodeoxyribonuclease VII large subunit